MQMLLRASPVMCILSKNSFRSSMMPAILAADSCQRTLFYFYYQQHHLKVLLVSAFQQCSNLWQKSRNSWYLVRLIVKDADFCTTKWQKNFATFFLLRFALSAERFPANVVHAVHLLYVSFCNDSIMVYAFTGKGNSLEHT